MNVGVVRVGFNGGNVYEFTSKDVEMFLEQYRRKHISKDTYKKVERWLWEFVKFLNGRKILKGISVVKPVHLQVYRVSRSEIFDYLLALEEAGYNKEDRIKRIRYVKKMLNAFNVKEFDEILLNEARKLKRQMQMEYQNNAIIVTVEDVRKFFKELEKLHNEGRIQRETYLKMIAFALLMVSTGRRKEEVAKIKMEWIDTKEGIVKFPIRETKEGKLAKAGNGYEISFLTKEAQEFLECFLREFECLIRHQRGHLFVNSEKHDFSTIFANKIMRKHSERLKFKLKKADYTFELKYFRKFFSQEWDRRVLKSFGIWNEEVGECLLGSENLGVFDVVKRRIMGHSIQDVHNRHYAYLDVSTMKRVYKKIYYNLEVLTEGQKKMVREWKKQKKF